MPVCLHPAGLTVNMPACRPLCVPSDFLSSTARIKAVL